MSRKVQVAGVFMALAAALAQAADPADEQAIQQTESDFVSAHSGVSADELENDILLTQTGSGNYAFGEQMGNTHSEISIEQVGVNNAAGAFQANGQNNQVNISQQGNDNFVAVTQNSDNNIATITQLNNANRLNLNQDGGDNAAQVTQLGSSSLVLNQTGGQMANITIEGVALGTITQASPSLNMTVTGP